MARAGQVGERAVVGGGGHPGAVPEAGAVGHRARRADGQDGHPPALEEPAELRARIPAECVLIVVAYRFEHERRVVVVHRERAARRQVRPGRRECLGGEQEALEADAALAGQRRQRVGQRVQDEVVLLLGVLQVLAAVADMDGDPRVLVGVGRVILPPDLHEHRVDLDRVDMPGSLGEGDRDIVPVPGPDDQDVAQARAGDVLVGQEVELLVPPYRRERVDSLVGNVVRGDEQYGIPVPLMQGQLVVRRPLLVRGH